jgi:succinate dehydrogenase / fumarate reductase cytochrome b subunit
MSTLGRFYRSSIGQKIVVAVTGALLVLFLIGHMLGNLQVFEGRGPTPESTRLNEYGKLLRLEPGFLWAIRLGLLVIAALHVWTTIRLTLANRRARGTAYAVKRSQAATLSSRTMIWGGLLLLAFIVLHILHFTTGHVFPSQMTQFGHEDVFSRVVVSFQNPVVALLYAAAMIVIFFHLRHGISSGVETLGVTNPRYLELFRKGGPLLAALVVLGFLAVPVLLWLGVVR